MNPFLTYFTNLQFSLTEYIIVGVLMLAFLYELYFYVRYIAAVNRQERRKKKKQKNHDIDLASDDTLRGVSVVVCARNEAYNLKEYLLQLLEQDYPLFEVIVVNDGSEDKTAEVLAEIALRYPNLRRTFVPRDARVGSSKKLALTLAAKSAKYDILLLTDADCVPATNHWIREMVGPLQHDNDAEIVIGYSPYFKEKGALNTIITYDTLFNGLQYMGQAIAGHPYMGVGRNLCYRKDFFFNTGGFTKILGVRSGDDDLFVNHHATKQNTRVVTSAESIVWSVPEQTWKNYMHQKRRHLSVSPYYKSMSKMRLTIEPFMRLLFYAAVILCCVTLNIPLIVFAATCFIARLIWQLSIINHAARHFADKTYSLNIILLDILQPLIAAYLMFTLWLFPSKRNRW